MTHLDATLAFLGPIGTQELIILAVIGVLIFGRRLPEVGRSIGKGIVEFKKGLAGVDDEVDAAAQRQKQLDQEAGNTTTVDTHAEAKADPSA